MTQPCKPKPWAKFLAVGVRATKNHRLQQLLPMTAVILSVILAVELIFDGLHPDAPNYAIRYVRRGIEYGILCTAYGLWLIQNYSPTIQLAFPTFNKILKGTALFLGIAWLGYPATTDIYLYLHYSLMALNGVNPYITGAAEFVSPMSPWLDWGQTSTYGPVSLAWFSLSALLTPLSVVVAVYSFKLTCLALHLFNSYLVWQELKSTKSSSWYRSWMTLAYLLNPILLFEQVCNAHLDVILCTVLILLIRFFRRRQSVRGFLTLWVGIFAKALPIIWLPLTVVFLLRSRQWKSLAIALFVCVVTVIGFSQILLVTPQAWLSLLNPGVSGKTAGSVHNLLNAFLMGIQSILPSIIAHRPGRVVRAFSLLTYLLYCVYYARLMLRVYFRKHYTADRLFLDLGWATLALFLLATPWYQPWYASVLLPFVILLPRGKNLAGIAIVYATTSSIAYYGLAYGPYDVPLAIVSLLTVGPPLALSTFQSRSQVLVD